MGVPRGAVPDSQPVRPPLPTESATGGKWGKGGGCRHRLILRAWRAIGGMVPWIAATRTVTGATCLAGHVVLHTAGVRNRAPQAVKSLYDAKSNKARYLLNSGLSFTDLVPER